MSGPDTQQTGHSFRPLPSLLIILVLAIVVLILQHSGIARIVTRENIETLSEFVQSAGAWGPVIYILVCIVASLLFCPGIPLLLLAAPFGALRGTIYAAIGLTLGSWIEGYAARNPMFRQIDEGVKREGWRMIMFTRLVPVFPYNIQNFAYGLTGIPLWIFALVSGICMLPAIAAYVFAGGALISGKGDIKKTLMYLAIGGALFVVLSYLPRLIRKWTRSAAMAHPDE